MKKIFSISMMLAIMLLAFTTRTKAQTNYYGSQMQEGQFQGFNLALTDTISNAKKKKDTLNFIFPITHTYLGYWTIDQRWKTVTKDTTITVKFWESMDNLIWFQVQNFASVSSGVITSGNYTKTIAKSATSPIVYNSLPDQVYFTMRYLKIMYIMASEYKSQVIKKIVYGYVKYNIY
jgi:hypothetical protein